MIETGAEKVVWDLTGLFKNEQELNNHIKKTKERADIFYDKYQDMNLSDLPAALREFESINEDLQKASMYGFLNWAVNTQDPGFMRVKQRLAEDGSNIMQKLLFFDLRLAELNENVLSNPKLSDHKHYIELQKLKKKYLLSEPEERILSEKEVTGRQAWSRFFQEVQGSLEFKLDGRSISMTEVINTYRSNPDREVRKRAGLVFSEGLQDKMKEITYILNMILADKKSDDKLRGYPNWLSNRNLENQVSDDSVNALIKAVTDRYDLVSHYFNLKKSLLGFDELFDYDRYALMFNEGKYYSWNNAESIVLESINKLDSSMGSIARSFFYNKWIHAAPINGKQSGAFCEGGTSTTNPFISLNYNGEWSNIISLAHELGHGIHFYLSRDAGILQMNSPLVIAESASTFCENLVFEDLFNQEDDPKMKLSMLMERIDDNISTVFRQTAMNRFEDKIHNHHRSSGELSTEDFCNYWVETQRDMYKNSVLMGDHYKVFWGYVPHFIRVPGYVYAYAFGDLLARSLLTKYKEQGDSFSEDYIKVLKKGGSQWPDKMFEEVGIHLNDPEFWSKGLKNIENTISQAEKLSKEI